MMRTFKWRQILASGGVVLAAYVLFLVVLAPATLLDAGLQRASDGKLRLAQAQGSLWSGNGVLEVRDQSGKRGVGKDLSWAWQPRALLHGQFGLLVNLDHAAHPFPIQVSAHGVELSNVDFSLPASALGVAVPRLAPLGLRGELAIHIAKLASMNEAFAVDGLVTWKDAGSALTAVAPLGTYVLRVDSNAGRLSANLRTSSGPLQLDGSGSSRDGDPLELSVNARVDARHRTQLVPLLRLIAIERGNGEFALQFNSPLDGASVLQRADEPQ